MRPTTSAERLEVLDALRGFALFGILFANLVSFFGYATLTQSEIVSLPGSDRFVLFLIDWLIEGKFYSIFSILFGIGFGLQAGRMCQSSTVFMAYWYRRMCGLFAFGLLHMVVIWHGDILTLYSLLGMLLPLFLSVSDRALVRWILCLLAAPLAIYAVTYVTSSAEIWGALSELARTLKANLGYGDRTLLEMRTSASTLEVLVVNLTKVIPRPMSYFLSGRYFQVLGLFLLGLYLSRTWLSRIGAGDIPASRSVAGFLVVGLICSFVYAWIKGAIGTPYALNEIGALQAVSYHVGAPSLALGIGWVFIRLWRGNDGSGVFRCFATLGRMALTNYLFQTSLCTLIFFGYGLGWMGRFPFYTVPMVAGLIVLAQWSLSRIWLRHRTQGPLESIWKKLSYGRRKGRLA